MDMDISWVVNMFESKKLAIFFFQALLSYVLIFPRIAEGMC